MAKFKGKLPKAVQRFIVQRFAEYDTPQVVADAVKEEFDIEVARQTVAHYQPSAPNLAQEWRDLFAAARAKFLADTTEIDVAQKAWRLRRLSGIARHYRESRNFAAERDTLKQAAEEAGDAYTNRRELTGRGGADLVPPVLNIVAAATAVSGES
jgi:hypothetical protein